MTVGLAEGTGKFWLKLRLASVDWYRQVNRLRISRADEVDVGAKPALRFAARRSGSRSVRVMYVSLMTTLRSPRYWLTALNGLWELVLHRGWDLRCGRQRIAA